MLPSSFRTIMTMAAAASVAGVISVSTAATDPVEANGSERLVIQPIGPACAQQAWPYYERQCVRDLRPQTSQIKPIRIVAIDNR